MEIWSYLLGLLPAVITGCVLFYVQRAQKKRDTEIEARAAARKEESLLSLELQMATAKLAYSTAIAVKRGTVNGEVEEGIEAYEKALGDFREFERRQITRL